MRRASPWMALLVLAACTLMAGLGVWQWQRGQFKQALLDAQAAAVAQAPQTLTRDTPATLSPLRVEAQGGYEFIFQLLLDHQTHEGRPGYQVLTPFRLDSGGLVLVNRGWLAADADRSRLPTLDAPSNVRRVRGLWRSLPQPGLRLAGTDNCPSPKNFPAVVTYPDVADLRCLLGADIADGVLWLDADVPGGYVRDWPAALVGFAPSRHYAYALQWFALSLTLGVLSVRFHRRHA